MTKCRSLILSAMTLPLIISSGACASYRLRLPPPLEMRTLRLDKDSPALVYQYETCVRKFFALCTKTEMHTDRWDLTDPKVRAMLIDRGFVMKVREDVTP